MMARLDEAKTTPLDIVGSTKFGRYPKISLEQTYNMIISDAFLVPYAGHLLIYSVFLQFANQGRGIYTSNRYNHMILVVDDSAYVVSANLSVTNIGTLSTFSGNVFIDENDNNQIGICDQFNLYIYNYVNFTFQTITATTLGFTPKYITFQNGRFIVAAYNGGGQPSTWQLSAIGDGTRYPLDSQHTGTFQTKPDSVIAALRFPSRGNLLFLFGSTVTEVWQDVGAQLFPYQRINSYNIDYGCLNPATIAFNDKIVVWLAANEKSGPVIMYSMGADPERISTDGIDFQFTQLKNPSNAYGFLFRQDGHLLYQLTFPDDNLTYAYDFNTQKFFTLCNENMDAHIAKQISFFNNKYYFISYTDGNLYEISTQYTTYNGAEIPRIRVTKNFRVQSSDRRVLNNLTFTIEQGVGDEGIYNSVQNVTVTNGGSGYTSAIVTFIGGEGALAQATATVSGGKVTGISVTNGGLNYIYAPIVLITGDGLGATAIASINVIMPRVDFSLSRDGGMSFSSTVSKQINRSGVFKNKLNFWNLGSGNDFVFQFRLWGMNRFVLTDGLVSSYK